MEVITNHRAQSKRNGGDRLKNSTATTYDQLPIILNAEHIASALGLSRAGAYELLRSKGFPTLRIGKRMMVSKENFIGWINRNSGTANA